MRTTQRQNVLRHLLGGPLCGVYDGWELGRRVAARIHDLRETGFHILTSKCNLGHDHQTHQILYKLYLTKPWYTWRGNFCAYCGPAGDLIYNGLADKPPDGCYRFEAVCGRCGKKDYR